MKVNKLKFLGLMVFITILMDVVPYAGFFHIGTVSITNLHIPAILTSIVLGPFYGMAMGLLFGIISLVRAISRGTYVLDFLMQNPMISVVPRLCFPLVSGFLYEFISGKLHKPISMGAAGFSSVVGSLSNSFLILGALFLVYPDFFSGAVKGAEEQALLASLTASFGPILLVEAVLAAAACLVALSLIRKLPANRER